MNTFVLSKLFYALDQVERTLDAADHGGLHMTEEERFHLDLKVMHIRQRMDKLRVREDLRVHQCGSLDPEVEERWKSLIYRDDYLRAIRCLQEAYTYSSQKAKNVIDGWSQSEEGRNYRSDPERPRPRWQLLAIEGNHTAAVYAYRDKHSCTFDEAELQVDRFMKEQDQLAVNTGT